METKRVRSLLRGVAAVWALVLFVGAGIRVLADCSAFDLPFTDLGSTSFCAQIAEAYFSGLTNGTSATGYSPSATVTREQMAAFVTRTLDQSLLRGNRRAALNQWWTSTPHFDKSSLGLTAVGIAPKLLASDGADIWVANFGAGTEPPGSVSRIRASDGTNLGTWTDADSATSTLVAMGKVFVAGGGGDLYMIDPTQAPASLSSIATIQNGATGIAFDGNLIWTANQSGSISIVTPGSTTPWAVTNVSAGFDSPNGIVFDGSNMWVTDGLQAKIYKLDSSATILQTVSVGANPGYPAFDGHNIWVPNTNDNTVSVVRISDGTVLKTFSAGQNGLSSPTQAAFDGQRILVTNQTGGVSLFKATDLSVIGNPTTPGMTTPYGVCSDGINFWISDAGSTNVGRF